MQNTASHTSLLVKVFLIGMCDRPGSDGLAIVIVVVGRTRCGGRIVAPSQMLCLIWSWLRFWTCRRFAPLRFASVSSAFLRSNQGSRRSSSHTLGWLRPSGRRRDLPPISPPFRGRPPIGWLTIRTPSARKLTGPPLIGPNWRSPRLRARSSRSGVCDALSCRQTFHAFGPRRKTSK
jgi:hypothetical protein